MKPGAKPPSKQPRQPPLNPNRGTGSAKPMEKKFLPTPIGDKCSPSCQLFRCTNNMLVLINKSYRGKVVREPYCRMTGSRCIGYECRFAGCRINALLPTGQCAKALERRSKHVSEEELLKEMKQMEDYDVEDFI